MNTKPQYLHLACRLATVALFLRTGFAADYEQNLDKSFSVTSGGKLDIQADRGSIEVATDGSEKAEVRVFRKVKGGSKAQADELLNNHEVTLAQDGNTVSVVARNRKERSGFWSLGRANLDVRYQVSIPRKFDVELKTAGGNIQVDDLDGQASAHTTSGSINLQSVTGNVKAVDAGGNISVAEAGGSLTAHTTSGSISLGPLFLT